MKYEVIMLHNDSKFSGSSLDELIKRCKSIVNEWKDRHSEVFLIYKSGRLVNSLGYIDHRYDSVSCE